ncbi:MAG TPA: FtsX-like permease family protein, partial [Bryobacteraceae bacterium]
GTAVQKILLSAQIALTLALVVASGLFTSSIQHVYEENLGVGIRGLSESSLSPLAGGYGGWAPGPYYHQLLQKIQNLPDVQSASLGNFAPFWTMPFEEPVAMIEGASGQTEVQAQPILITDQFVRTLGLRLLEGDGFRASEEQSSEPVALISEPLARRLGGQRVIGSHIRVGTGEQFQHLKVTGIISNAQFSLVNPEDTEASIVYLNFWRYPTGYPWVFVKTISGLPISSKILRAAVHSLGREYVERYSTAAVEKDSALVENRLLAYLSSAFALLGLCLAAVGLFGLLSYHVVSRTNEIGVRMALGAARSQIRSLVVHQVVRVVLAGIVGGSLMLAGIGPLIRSFVYGIGVYDWRLLCLAILILLLTSILAAWIPAQRAASVEPLAALRHN